jgi:hypothetical protein
MALFYDRVRGKEAFMSDWVPIGQWGDCRQMERPGIIFELRNAEGLSMFAPCAPTVPAPPHDWKSPPVVFRAIAEPRPRHSGPIPKPQ